MAEPATFNTQQDTDEQARINKAISHNGGKSAFMSDLFKKVQPLAMSAFVFLLNMSGPVGDAYDKAHTYIKALPTDILHAVYGFAMCFFGGHFAISIAAIEAFQISGWDRTATHLNALAQDWTNLLQAHKADELVDANNDGVADVRAMSKQELLRHKVMLFLKTTDPSRVSNALGGLYTGLVGILATLQLQFARVVTLGISIGNALRKPAGLYVAPALAQVLPAHLHQWIGVIISYTCKFIAVTLAWYIQAILSTVQSAIRGGLMCSRALLKFASERHMIQGYDEAETMLDEYVGWTLAAIGAYFQISSGFSLPFILRLVLFPLEITEFVLRWLVTPA